MILLFSTAFCLFSLAIILSDSCLQVKKVASKDFCKKGVEGGLLATMVDSAVIG